MPSRRPVPGEAEAGRLARAQDHRARGGALAVHLKALACNVKRMVGYLVERGRKAGEAVSAAAEAAGEAAASSLRVILTGVWAGIVTLTGWWRVPRPWPIRVRHGGTPLAA
jgi:hypothetical protein